MLVGIPFSGKTTALNTLQRSLDQPSAGDVQHGEEILNDF